MERGCRFKFKLLSAMYQAFRILFCRCFVLIYQNTGILSSFVFITKKTTVDLIFFSFFSSSRKENSCCDSEWLSSAMICHQMVLIFIATVVSVWLDTDRLFVRSVDTGSVILLLFNVCGIRTELNIKSISQVLVL